MGSVALTAKVYAQNITMFIFVFSLAIGQRTQILIGHQVGANNMEEAYRRCIKSLKIVIPISTGVALVFYFFNESLFSIFTSNKDITQIWSLLLLLTIILEPGTKS